MNQARRLTIGFVSLIAIVLLLCSCPALAQGEPATSNEVYLSNEGSDDNSGTEEAPVKTFARAKELLATDGTIYIIDGMLTVSDSQSWSLEGYGQATVKRAGGSTIVELTEGASLTLEHIILDGGIEVPDRRQSDHLRRRMHLGPGGWLRFAQQQLQFARRGRCRLGEDASHHEAGSCH